MNIEQRIEAFLKASHDITLQTAREIPIGLHAVTIQDSMQAAINGVALIYAADSIAHGLHKVAQRLERIDDRLKESK